MLTFILTVEHQHQARKFFHRTDTLPSQYYNIGMRESLHGEKTFCPDTDVPHLKTQSKLENNWESTNNFKLWLLNKNKRLSTLQNCTYAVDSYKAFSSCLTTPSEK